jgi:hypothetical protein
MDRLIAMLVAMIIAESNYRDELRSQKVEGHATIGTESIDDLTAASVVRGRGHQQMIDAIIRGKT